MRSRRPSPEHQDAVSRRLALLSAELSAVRPQPPDPEPSSDGEWWDEHTRIARPRWTPPSPPTPPSLPPDPRHLCRCRDGTPPAAGAGPAIWSPAPCGAGSSSVPRSSRWWRSSSRRGWESRAWWVVRSDSAPAAGAELVAAPAAALVPVEPVARAGESAATAVAAGDAATPATVTVDVAGKVRRPGIAVLDAGARVVDALEAAGGARAGVDVAGLNLARVLVDGEQILVGLPSPPGVAAGAVPTTGEPPAVPVVMVNLNTADGSQLETLPEVGPVTASSILAWRDTHGGFTSVDELLEVDGIGEATLAKIAPHVTV